VITIGSEMATGLDHEYAQHRREFGLDVRLNMALARSFTARDYVLAQRVRTRAISHFAQALTQADVLVTPATGCVAPPIPADALPDGESDLTLLVEAMRFAVAANLTGLPAISFPAGYDERGLPIGFQAMGRPWSEHTLLRLANVAERVVERKRPQLHYALLAGG
jgi:Asp-tRNA(Asn)/Glu-tRNA(Gln) amidotransferase A subunit family amidase